MRSATTCFTSICTNPTHLGDMQSGKRGVPLGKGYQILVDFLPLLNRKYYNKIKFGRVTCSMKMATSQFNSIGFIGLGAMGKWMATHLAEKLSSSSKIHVFDIVQALVDELVSEYGDKVVACSSPKDVADKSVCPPKLSAFGIQTPALLTSCTRK